jgi:hypothetical protein
MASARSLIGQSRVSEEPYIADQQHHDRSGPLPLTAGPRFSVPSAGRCLSRVTGITAGPRGILTLSDWRFATIIGWWRRKAESDAGVLTIMCSCSPPGAGTSMLARRLSTILPVTTLAGAIEITRIHRVAGRTGDRTALMTTRPCPTPHHPISDVGLIGGGHVPMPGDVSRAHHGILFLDELPEFRRHVVEVSRQPREKSVIGM